MNRTEYFNTLRDLFYLDENYIRSLKDELPPDGKVDGFDRIGSALYIDQAQLAKYSRKIMSSMFTCIPGRKLRKQTGSILIEMDSPPTSRRPLTASSSRRG